MMNNENNKIDKKALKEQKRLERKKLLDEIYQPKFVPVEKVEKQKVDISTDLGKTILCANLAYESFCQEENYDPTVKELDKNVAFEEAVKDLSFKDELYARFDRFKKDWNDPTFRMIKTKRILEIFAVLFRTFILIGLCFVILLPIFEKFSFALRHPTDVSNPQVIFIPENWSFKNVEIGYQYLTMATNKMPITFLNSFVLSTVTMVIQVLATALAGYAFAKLKFRGSNIIFYLVIFTLIVPNETLDISRRLFFTYTSFFGINLLYNSFAIYIMSAFGMGVRSAIFIYLFRQFFRGLPVELEESADIDGAGVLRTFFSVMLPNARGTIITVGLFAFVWQYNDYYFANLFKFHDVKVMPLVSTSLASSAETFNSFIGTSFAELINELGTGITQNRMFFSYILNTSALLMMLPLIIGYLFVQRLFVESIERTGITGM